LWASGNKYTSGDSFNREFACPLTGVFSSEKVQTGEAREIHPKNAVLST
jgi:hypothetical protein